LYFQKKNFTKLKYKTFIKGEQIIIEVHSNKNNLELSLNKTIIDLAEPPGHNPSFISTFP